MNISLKEKQEDIIEEFSMYDDWMEKYELIVSKGKELETFPEEHRKDENLIKGCQSKLWLHAENQDGIIHFYADADAIIAKGLVAMMLEVFNDRNAKEILEEEIYFIEKIGLTHHLSPTRSNGLLSLLKQIKLYAIAFSSK